MERDFIKKPSEWIRSLRPGEKKQGVFETVEKIHSFSVILTRENHSHAVERGYVIKAHYNMVMRIVTIYTEEYAI